MGCRGQEDTKLIILLLLPTFCKGVGAAKEDARGGTSAAAASQEEATGLFCRFCHSLGEAVEEGG